MYPFSFSLGFWAHEVGKLTGLELPLVPIQHQYLITKPIDEIEKLEVRCFLYNLNCR